MATFFNVPEINHDHGGHNDLFEFTGNIIPLAKAWDKTLFWLMRDGKLGDHLYSEEYRKQAAEIFAERHPNLVSQQLPVFGGFAPWCNEALAAYHQIMR